MMFTEHYQGDLDENMEGFFGKLYFLRTYAYQPWTVTDITNGNVLAEVVEIGKGEGLEGDISHYSILVKGEPSYPWYTWSKLLAALRKLT